MNVDEAIEIIRACLSDDRYRVSTHFEERMDERQLVWMDVVAIIEEPSDVREDGVDKDGWPKFVVVGETIDGLEVEIVAAIRWDAAGNMTVFITLYHA